MTTSRIAISCVLCFPTFSLCQEVNIRALVDQYNPAARTELQKAREVAMHDDASAKIALRQQLKDQFRSVNDAYGIRQISLALGCLPIDDESLLLLGAKLGAPQGDKTTVEVCRGIGMLSQAGQATLQSSTKEQLCAALYALASNVKTSPRVAEQAILTLGSMGSAGFDTLVTLKTKTKLPKVNEMFVTAIASTGDVRALTWLRDAVSNARTQGEKIQAIHGLRTAFDASRLAGAPFPSAEMLSCRELIRGVVHSADSDQMFQSAMNALAAIDQTDSELPDLIQNSLLSDNSERRQAALEVLHDTDLKLSDDALSWVHSLAVTDANEGTRAMAQAVMDKVSSQN